MSCLSYFWENFLYISWVLFSFGIENDEHCFPFIIVWEIPVHSGGGDIHIWACPLSDRELMDIGCLSLFENFCLSSGRGCLSLGSSHSIVGVNYRQSHALILVG